MKQQNGSKEILIDSDKKRSHVSIIFEQGIDRSEGEVCLIHDMQKLLKSRNQVIVLSPHLDDAALSAGNLISALSALEIKVQVVNVFTESSGLMSSPIRSLLRSGGYLNSQAYFTARRAEDKNALKELGNIESRCLGYVDGAWRSHGDKPLYDACAGASISPHDADLIESIRNCLTKLITIDSNCIVLAPLARGKHVDHQIVRNIAADLRSDTLFYEDIPYSAKYENEYEFIEDHELTPLVWKQQLEEKRKSLLKYRTQHLSLVKYYGGEVISLPHERYYMSKKHL